MKHVPCLFKVRCATRSRSDPDSSSVLQCSSSKSSELPGTKSSSKSIELKRDNSDTDRSESHSDLFISPEVPVASPYAGNNLYSYLKVDSPNLSESEISTDTKNSYVAFATALPDPVSPSMNFQRFMEASIQAFYGLAKNPIVRGDRYLNGKGHKITSFISK